MTGYLYTITGMILGILAGGLLIGILSSAVAARRKVPLYRKKLNKVKYREGFFEEALAAYRSVGEIRQTLLVLQNQPEKKDTLKRIARTLDYLENSRYRDYETALYQYLSDGSDTAQKVIGEILDLEIQKYRRLPDKRRMKYEK